MGSDRGGHKTKYGHEPNNPACMQAKVEKHNSHGIPSRKKWIQESLLLKKQKTKKRIRSAYFAHYLVLLQRKEANYDLSRSQQKIVA